MQSLIEKLEPVLTNSGAAVQLNVPNLAETVNGAKRRTLPCL